MSFIETDRLILRTWMLSDLDAAAAIYGDAEVTRYLKGGVRSREQVRAWIEMMIEMQDREGFSLWPVVLKSDSRIIGICGLFRDGEGRGVEIGWAFERASWGAGFGAEAAGAALAYAGGVLNLKRVAALVDKRNGASIAMANRLGLRFDRVVRSAGREMMRYLS
jgi:[ribosomal protein S5]-alanine N-acetyltransferase